MALRTLGLEFPCWNLAYRCLIHAFFLRRQCFLGLYWVLSSSAYLGTGKIFPSWFSPKNWYNRANKRTTHNERPLLERFIDSEISLSSIQNEIGSFLCEFRQLEIRKRTTVDVGWYPNIPFPQRHPDGGLARPRHGQNPNKDAVFKLKLRSHYESKNIKLLFFKKKRFSNTRKRSAKRVVSMQKDWHAVSPADIVSY